MADLPPKLKEALALLYEYPEFKALEKWNEAKRQDAAKELLSISMGFPGSSERVAFLQGQAHAHQFMLLELKKIHKEVSSKNES